jgi:hypothetical protein
LPERKRFAGIGPRTANDQVAGIRVGAIEALTQYSNDEQVARTVQEVTKDDDNAYIRSIGLRFVGSR